MRIETTNVQYKDCINRIKNLKKQEFALRGKRRIICLTATFIISLILLFIYFLPTLPKIHSTKDTFWALVFIALIAFFLSAFASEFLVTIFRGKKLNEYQNEIEKEEETKNMLEEDIKNEYLQKYLSADTPLDLRRHLQNSYFNFIIK